jgi:hypothetical protein
MGRDYSKGSSNNQRKSALQRSGMVSGWQHQEQQTGSQYMYVSFPPATSLPDRHCDLPVREQTSVSMNTI